MTRDRVTLSRGCACQMSRPDPTPGVLLALLLLVPGSALAAPGFFTVEQRDGIWWLIDPDGKPFLSRGVCMVNRGTRPSRWRKENPSYSALRSYPSARAWEDDTLARLGRWGFNTLGAWSDERLCARGEMPFTICLHLGASAAIPWVDMWDPALEESVRRMARRMTARWRESRMLIGYFPDNEMSWWDTNIFDYHLGLPWRGKIDTGKVEAWKENATKLKLVGMFRETYGGDFGRFLAEWEIPEFRVWTEKDEAGEEVKRRERQRVRSFDDLKGPVHLRRRLGRRPKVIDAFMEALYDRYGELMRRAISAADENHLLLGERFHQHPIR